MYLFIKYIVTLFYKKLRIKIVVCLLRESGPWFLKKVVQSVQLLYNSGELECPLNDGDGRKL